MDWVTIITVFGPMILKMLEECTKRDGEQAVFARLRSGGLVVRLTARNMLQSQGLRGRELHAAVDDWMDMLKRASDDDLRALLAEAKAAGSN